MLTLIRNGQEYPLDTGIYCDHLGDNGWGMTPVGRLSMEGPQQHGATDYGFRLQPRLATLVLGLDGSSLADLWDRREALLSLFGPLDPISLRWTWGSMARQIDGYFVKDLSMPSAGRSGFYQKVAVTIKCPDPTFYDPVLAIYTFGLGGGSNTFVVPMPVPHHVGASSLDETTGVAYAGSWISHPTIRIEGPITNPVIANLTTNEVLDFTGITIASSDYYDIDTRYGAKTVIDKNGTNKIANLADDSDLATFHIRPKSNMAPGGSNSIQVTGSSVGEATKVTLKFYVRFLGI